MAFFKSLRKGRKSSFSSEAGLNNSPNGNAGKTSRSGRGDDDAASMMAGPTSATSSPQQARLGQGASRGVVGSPIQEDGPAGISGLGPASPTLSPGGENKGRGGRGFFTRSNSKRDTLVLPQRTLSYGQSAAGSASDHGTPASPPFETAPVLSPSSNAIAEATAEAANQPPGGARPSDLFAGKGLAWGEVDLSPNGTTVAKTPQQTDDLSNFLKARRQWVPTFVTGGKQQEDIKPVSKPDDITFSNLPSAGNVMSLSDLDASHKRKQHLLGSDFETTALIAASENLATSMSGLGVSPSTSRSASSPPITSSPVKPTPIGTSLFAPSSSHGRSSPARKAVPSPIAAESTQNVPAANAGQLSSSGSSAKLVTSNGNSHDAVTMTNGTSEANASGDGPSAPAAEEETTSAAAPPVVQQEASHVGPTATSVPQDTSKAEEKPVSQMTAVQETVASHDGNASASDQAKVEADAAQPEVPGVPEPLSQAEVASSDGASGAAAPALTFTGGYGSSSAEHSSKPDGPHEEAASTSEVAAAPMS
ncbi:hypothetical protein BCV69DRAFT_309866 [Microstroma glucosiphilum]|uniref:Uncharacterized protein n=1 Tax=Pseudomicrostroma glucosiphilum TaxID=1684307 RepID=A0A316UGI0_9BASI|nr:hypothetical protein BCV69DRAFT_309866 [Pseudomicrostroma glucosiphilum]PWN24014.1 hypothetical protein BCV69DRAFT_309866 [Pseudomicrostroma glucosiphilum]